MGGHYYGGTVTSDPWTNVAYTSSDGTLSTTISVPTGMTAADLLGRVFIVHGETRVGVGVGMGGGVAAGVGVRVRWIMARLRSG